MVAQERFEEALVQKHAAGTLQPHHVVPALYGVWVGDVARRVELDHLHLPGGDSLDYPSVFDPDTHRLDALMLCPKSAQQCLMLGLSSAIIVVCLN